MATSVTALSADPAVAVPVLTFNCWILMQRKVTAGSVSFNQSWEAYRDGFGSATGNDNYWLGLDKVHRLVQMGSVALRVEVDDVYWHASRGFYPRGTAMPDNNLECDPTVL